MLGVHIENFKSIDRLDLELGRVNLFIGENGCGKSNILETFGMAAAAANHNFSAAALKARGIRATDPIWMRSAFNNSTSGAPINILLVSEGAIFGTCLTHPGAPYAQWNDVFVASAAPFVSVPQETLERIRREWYDVLLRMGSSLAEPPAAIANSTTDVELKQFYTIERLREGARALNLLNFLAYAPREDVLRDLARDSDVEPIGVHGEGLFKLLQVLDSEGQLPEVKEQLSLLGWFDDLTVASGVNPSSRALQIRDVFLSGDTPFDQRSANEGFLFVLLHACLLISKHTPRFFAVDNVDTALNPKLCAGAVRMFAELTRKYDRRVLLTAHNPGALDGLDLHDDEQRLFVVYRNTEGRTRARRILPADLPAGTEPVRLSEAFLRGYLGALPTNF